ncbi:Isochorismatase hydrolase [Ramicandelaber brevisporus]|nr:Isochorismatase hydrolase [Ramicandelaber brevisporus]
MASLASTAFRRSALVSSKLAPSTTAFFVCDIQERFRSLIHAFPSVVATSKKLLETADALSIPVVITEQNPKSLGATVSELALTTTPRLTSTLYTTYPKTKFSMYTPEVATRLKELGTKDVVLFGIESHVCVLQTALELLRNDYGVHVVADGVSSMNYPEIDIALNRMASEGAVVVSSESLMFMLLEDAKHDKFKTVSSIVKKYQEAARENQLLFKSRV